MIRYFTAGESHGQGLVIIVEGVPAGLPLDEAFIGTQLGRRQKGYGRGGRMLIEQDHAKLKSEADNRFQKTNDQLTALYEQDSNNTNEEYTNLLGLARNRYETDLEKLELEQQQFNGQAQRQHESDRAEEGPEPRREHQQQRREGPSC